MLTWTKYPVLKREDAVVYQTAKSLGLAVDVKPICREGLEWIRQVRLMFRINKWFVLQDFQKYRTNGYIEGEGHFD